MNKPPTRLLTWSAISGAILAVSTASIFIRFARENRPRLPLQLSGWLSRALFLVRLR